jgi:hypothetical protein
LYNFTKSPNSILANFYLVPISLLVVVFALLLAFHTGVRMFFTLLLQILLEYVDRLSGFSHLFSNSRVERMENKLRVLRERKQEPRNIEEDSEEGSVSSKEEIQDHVSFWRNISTLVVRPFRRRGRKGSSFGRKSSASPPDA